MSSSVKAEKAAKPVLAILLIVSALYLFLSLVSYSSEDPSWNFASSKVDKISNLGGLVGGWLADSFLQLLGAVSYLLCFGLFVIGLQKIRPQILLLDEIARNRRRPKWHLFAALGLFLLSSAALLSLLPFKIYNTIPLGGIIGFFFAKAGTFCFSPVGATLLFGGGLVASLILFRDLLHFSIPLPNLGLENLFLPVKNFFVEWRNAFTIERKAKVEPKVHHQEKASRPLSEKLDQLFKRKVSAAEPIVSEPVVTEPTPHEDLEPQKKLFLLKKPEEKEPEVSDGDRVLLMREAPQRKKKEQKSFRGFELPSLQLLDLPEERNFEISKDELIQNSKALEQKLLDFGVEGHVTNIRPGPIITLYEFEPAAGVKVKNIVNLTDDLKLAMKAVSIRIIAPIPGRAAVGIEIPNPRRQTVYLREILQSPLFQNSPSPITMGMGKTTAGDSYVTDLAKMPHLLIAGATGSGKSVGLNAIVVSMLFKASPDELKFIMIDPKMLELSVYEGIPHLLLPVVTDPKKAARALAWAVKEMERRYKLISSLGARNLKSFNEKVEKLTAEELKREVEIAAQTEATTSALIDEGTEVVVEDKQQELALQEAGLDHYVKLPNIVVVIDELADLIMVAAREVEESIARLAQMARAAGIHLIIATQRPSVDVITGVIKANLPTRCAFQVASKVDSRTIIDGSGAENLIGDGDMLFLPPGTSRLERLHGPFISEDEIARVVRHLRTQADPDYSANINLEEEAIRNDEDGFEEMDDALYDQALQVVFETKSPSASMLQRRLRVGYNRAARMIERMEREGVVSPPLAGGKGREILVTPSYDT